jgi:predicted RNase H-like HicB family nuclease
MMKLHIQVAEKDGKWHAWVPSVPWVQAVCETAQEAVEMAAVLAASSIANLQALGKPSYGPNLSILP